MSFSGDTRHKIVFRLSHMGDVALTTGVLAHWNEKRCETFTFITRAGNAPVLENHPAVTEVVTLDDAELNGLEWFKNGRKLAEQYAGHELIDLHGTLRSKILSLLWKGKVHRYPKFGLVRRLYDKTHAERFRRVLEATNVTQRYAMARGDKPPMPEELLPRIHLTELETDDGIYRLQELVDSRPVVALHPYATHPAKQWPRCHWLELTSLLTSAGLNWIVVGRDKKPLFPDHERDFTNRTDLRETCSLLKRADILVTADSGPMHLACGVETPVLAMFGPTSKAWGFFPAGPRDQVIEMNLDCRPCSLHGSKECERGFECLSGITPESVIQILRNRFEA